MSIMVIEDVEIVQKEFDFFSNLIEKKQSLMFDVFFCVCFLEYFNLIDVILVKNARRNKNK